MSNKSVDITYEDHPTKGRYVARMKGVGSEGELTTSKVTDHLIIADQTFVPEAMRGTGAGSALVNRLVEDARAKGQRIVPLCPFVRAQSLRHPEWADVMQH